MPIFMLIVTVMLVIYSNVIVKARSNVFDGKVKEGDWVEFLVSMLSDPIIWTAVAATGLAMVLYLLALRRIDVSVAQPALAMVFVAVPLMAALFLGEQLSPLRIGGLACIALGVVLVLCSA